jgi:peptide deformylase
MEYGDENSYEKEGCLSYPGLMIAISRPNSTKAQFEVKDGSTKGAVFTDLSSRIFQHEMEHMKGRDFFWEVSNIKLKQAMKKRKLHLKRMKRNAKI